MQRIYILKIQRKKSSLLKIFDSNQNLQDSPPDLDKTQDHSSEESDNDKGANLLDLEAHDLV